MKKNVLILSLILISLFFNQSCVKQDNLDDSSFQIGMKSSIENDYQNLYYKIIKVDIDHQKQVVNSFDYKTQSILFKLKLDNYASNNKLNNKQKQALKKWKSFLTPDNLKKVREKKDKVLSNKIRILKTEILNSFEKNVGWYLINKFENTNQTLAKIKLKKSNSELNTGEPNTNGTKNIIRDCDCTKDSNCIRVTGISIWGISWEHGRCTQKTCYSGSGFLGLFENQNNGLCVYMDVRG